MSIATFEPVPCPTCLATDKIVEVWNSGSSHLACDRCGCSFKTSEPDVISARTQYVSITQNGRTVRPKSFDVPTDISERLRLLLHRYKANGGRGVTEQILRKVFMAGADHDGPDGGLARVRKFLKCVEHEIIHPDNHLLPRWHKSYVPMGEITVRVSRGEITA